MLLSFGKFGVVLIGRRNRIIFYYNHSQKCRVSNLTTILTKELF